MQTYELTNNASVADLITTAYRTNEPVVVSDDGFECLIAMQPAVFERVLFGTAVLNCTDRLTMRL